MDLTCGINIVLWSNALKLDRTLKLRLQKRHDFLWFSFKISFVDSILFNHVEQKTL